MITFLSSKIADFLYRHNIIKKEDIEICRYGYEVLFFNIMNMAIIIILGLALDKFLYSFIFFIIFALVRQCCGGYHSKSTIICTFVYVGIFIAIMFLATTEYTEKYFTLPIDMILCLSYISSAAAHAPIDNKNKSISDEKRKRLKKISIILGCILTLAAVLIYKVNLHISAVISLTLMAIAILMLIGKQIRKGE